MKEAMVALHRALCELWRLLAVMCIGRALEHAEKTGDMRAVLELRGMVEASAGKRMEAARK